MEQCSAICQWDHATNNTAPRVEQWRCTATMKEALDNLPVRPRHQQYCTTCRTMKMYCNNERSWTMHEPFLYRWQFRLRQSREQNNGFGVILLDNVIWQLITTIISFRFPECLKTILFFNNLRDGVKIQVYIQYIVIPVVYNMCTQCILQGPWVKWLWDNCREYKRCWVTYNTTCTSWVDFYTSMHPSTHPPIRTYLPTYFH